MTALATGNIAAAAPILIVVAAIVALVAIFKLAWDNSEKFRKAVKELAEAVGGALKEGMEKIKKALGDVGASTENLREIFKKIGDFLGTYIVPFFKEVLVLAIGLVVDAIVIFIKFVKGMWDAFTSGNPLKVIGALFDSVVALVKSIVERVAKAFGFKISWAWLTDGLEAAVNLIAKGINKVSETLNKAIGGFNKLNPFKDIPPIPMIGVPIKLAKGGIIPATPGGVLATIGEAGRPERVEPLDPDGLSKRDRAMIAMLSGGGAGGISITVNPSPGMDERELAALVSRQLAFQLRKGAA
jgi:phage-related minor tail protein